MANEGAAGSSNRNPSGWEIAREDLSFIKKLDEGNFGAVWYGKIKNDLEVAIKTLKQGCPITPEEYLREAETMKKLNHPSIVILYGHCSVGEPVHIVIEYFPNGSLLEYFKTEEGKNLKVLDLCEIGIQISAGMAYLEFLEIIHRDIAARNVLVTEEKRVKLGDFGLARYVGDSEEKCYHPRVGSFLSEKWTAPESLIDETLTSKGDIWSFGVFLWEVFSYGEEPYKEYTREETIDVVLDGYRMPKPENTPKPVHFVMMDCWHPDPEERPNFKKVCNFLKNFATDLELGKVSDEETEMDQDTDINDNDDEDRSSEEDSPEPNSGSKD